jgi:hypothetical protein
VEQNGPSARYTVGPRDAILAAALLLLGACSGGESKDLPTIREARSLAAEWALVNHQAESGRLRPAYVRAMREEAIAQLESALGGMTAKDGAAASEISVLTRLAPDAPAGLLYAHARRLKAVEDGLEAR